MMRIDFKHVRRDKNTEISKGKTATTALNALQQLFLPHLCGEDS